jgi:hypothetical protein
MTERGHTEMQKNGRSRWAAWTGLALVGSALGLGAVEPLLSRAAFVLAVIGWGTLGGGLFLLLLARCTRAAATASSTSGPATVTGRSTGDHDDLASTRAAAAGFPSTVDHLSTADLCRAWCRSTTALRGSASVSYRAAVVGLRAAYLDELERRHPVGVAAWLSCEDWAAVDPMPYVRVRDRPTRRAGSQDDRDRRDG